MVRYSKWINQFRWAKIYDPHRRAKSIEYYSDNNISSLFVDHNGLVWIGNRIGLDIYIPSKERFVNIPIPEKNDINHISNDESNKIWINTGNGIKLIERLSNKDYQFEVVDFVSFDFIDNSTINSFHFSKEKLLLATTNGLFETTVNYSKSKTEISSKNLLSVPEFKNLNVLSIKEFEDGYWIGTDDGVFFGTITEGSFQVKKHFKKEYFEIKDRFPFVVISIFVDKSGANWFGTKHHGLIKYDLKKDSYTNYQHNPKNPNGISSTYINCVFQDNF